MSWWLWLLLAGGALVLLAVGVSTYFHRQFSQGIGALIKAAQETLLKSGDLVAAEVFGGPMVEGARVLRLQEQGRAREELMEAIRHSRFAFWKLFETVLADHPEGLTDTQKTILTKDAEGLVDSHLCRLYFSAYQLGLVFVLREYWGPFAPEIALSRPYTKAQAQEKAASLHRYHPWVREVLKNHVQGYQSAFEKNLSDLIQAQALSPPAMDGFREKAEDILMELSIQGLCYGIFQGQNRQGGPSGAVPAQVNGTH